MVSVVWAERAVPSPTGGVPACPHIPSTCEEGPQALEGSAWLRGDPGLSNPFSQSPWVSFSVPLCDHL